MRTTIEIDDALLSAAERVAMAAGRSVDSVIADALRHALPLAEASMAEDARLAEAGLRLMAESLPPEDFSDWERADG